MAQAPSDRARRQRGRRAIRWRAPVTGKPTVADLGIDVTAQSWRRSGAGAGSIEIAVVRPLAGAGDEWVLMRVAGDPVERVLVYDRHEWECFLDGVRNGEFDDAFD